MKRLAPILLALALLGLFAAAPTATAGKKLPHSATFKLKQRIAHKAQSDQMGYPASFKCVRKSRTKFRCVAIARAENDLAVTRCRYVGVVKNKRTVRRKRHRKIVRWKRKYSVKQSGCSESPKPPPPPALRLEESDAVNAVGQQASEQMGHGVTLHDFRRDGETVFLGWVHWREPLIPGDILNPVQLRCESDVRVELIAAGDIRVTFSEPVCGLDL